MTSSTPGLIPSAYSRVRSASSCRLDEIGTGSQKDAQCSHNILRLQQLTNYPAAIGDRHRPPFRRVELLLGIDAEQMIDRSGEVFRPMWVAGGTFGTGVGGA